MRRPVQRLMGVRPLRSHRLPALGQRAQLAPSLTAPAAGVRGDPVGPPRAAQVYETCILARRCVMTLATRMERSTSPWPFRLLEAAARLRRELEVSLPIQSDEALGLMSTAYDRFGMGRLWALLDDARKGLESRSQWRKAQLVALVGVLTYLLDKLGVLGLLSRRMLPP